MIGLICNLLNFMQIPLWLSWNLYVGNKKYIDVQQKYQTFYVLGTLIGSFAGILTSVIIINYANESISIVSKYLMLVLIPLFFFWTGLVSTICILQKIFL